MSTVFIALGTCILMLIAVGWGVENYRRAAYALERFGRFIDPTAPLARWRLRARLANDVEVSQLHRRRIEYLKAELHLANKRIGSQCKTYFDLREQRDRAIRLVGKLTLENRELRTTCAEYLANAGGGFAPLIGYSEDTGNAFAIKDAWPEVRLRKQPDAVNRWPFFPGTVPPDRPDKSLLEPATRQETNDYEVKGCNCPGCTDARRGSQLQAQRAINDALEKNENARNWVAAQNWEAPWTTFPALAPATVQDIRDRLMDLRRQCGCAGCMDVLSSMEQEDVNRAAAALYEETKTG